MRHLFDEVIGTPPPTSIDSRALVRRDRRARAARWSTLGATAVAAGIAVAAFTTATTPAGTPPVGAPPTGASSPGPQPAPDNRLELRAATRQEAEVSAGRLKTALDAAVRAAVPEAAWGDKGFTVTVIDYVTPMGWIGTTDVTVGTAIGPVSVMLHGLPTTAAIDPLTCAALAAIPRKDSDRKRVPGMPSVVTQCVDAHTPSGKPVVTFTTTGDVSNVEVRVGMADNRVMTLVVGGYGVPPVLSLDQVILIAQQATDRIK